MWFNAINRINAIAKIIIIELSMTYIFRFENIIKKKNNKN
jgi:hypothetical protein